MRHPWNIKRRVTVPWNEPRIPCGMTTRRIHQRRHRSQRRQRRLDPNKNIRPPPPSVSRGSVVAGAGAAVEGQRRYPRNRRNRSSTRNAWRRQGRQRRRRRRQGRRVYHRLLCARIRIGISFLPSNSTHPTTTPTDAYWLENHPRTGPAAGGRRATMGDRVYHHFGLPSVPHLLPCRRGDRIPMIEARRGGGRSRRMIIGDRVVGCGSKFSRWKSNRSSGLYTHTHTHTNKCVS